MGIRFNGGGGGGAGIDLSLYTLLTTHNSAHNAQQAAITNAQAAINGLVTALNNKADTLYVDNKLLNIQQKTACRAVIGGSEFMVGGQLQGLSNPSTAGSAITLDGVTLVNGDRVLRNSTSSKALNGIWVVNAGGTWGRALDANTGSLIKDALVATMEGTAFGDKIFKVITDGTITINSTAIDWAVFGSPFVPLGGTGINVPAGSSIINLDTAYTDARYQLKDRVFNAWFNNTALTLGEGNPSYINPGATTAFVIPSYAQLYPGATGFLRIISSSTSDTLTITPPAGGTVDSRGFQFQAGVTNELWFYAVSSTLLVVAINPVV